MDFAALSEWVNLAIRWLHLITGIAWIGASFYFISLDNQLDPPADKNPLVHGEQWAVHGGGFYYKRKYLLAPEKLPEKLHWFKWEAYWTWISGFALFVLDKITGEFGEAGTLPVVLAAWAPAGAGFLLAAALLLHLEDG